jgi:hypothetical protein
VYTEIKSGGLGELALGETRIDIKDDLEQTALFKAGSPEERQKATVKLRGYAIAEAVGMWTEWLDNS